MQQFDNMRSLNPLSIILKNHRLIGPNFIDWLYNLKVILASEHILYVLKQSPPGPLPPNVMQEECDTLKNGKMMTCKLVALCGLL